MAYESFPLIIIVSLFIAVNLFSKMLSARLGNNDTKLANFVMSTGISLVLSALITHAEFTFGILAKLADVPAPAMSVSWITLFVGLLMLGIGVYLRKELKDKIFVLNMYGITPRDVSEQKAIKELRLSDFKLKEQIINIIPLLHARDANTEINHIICGLIKAEALKFVNRAEGQACCFTGMAPIPYTVLAGTYLASADLHKYFEFDKHNGGEFYEVKKYCRWKWQSIYKRKSWAHLSVNWPHAEESNATEIVIAISILITIGLIITAGVHIYNNAKAKIELEAARMELEAVAELKRNYIRPHIGSARSLHGHVHIVSFFISDLRNDWSYEEREVVLYMLDKTKEWFKREALRYGITNLRFTSKSYGIYEEIRYNGFLENGRDARFRLGYTDVFRQIGWENSFAYYEAMKEKYGFDNFLVIQFLHRVPPMLRWFSYAFPLRIRYFGMMLEEGIVDLSIMPAWLQRNRYVEATSIWLNHIATGHRDRIIAHEILHLFGAVDLYFHAPGGMVTTFELLQEIITLAPNSIMGGQFYMPLEVAEVDELTAWLIGWHDEPKSWYARFVPEKARW